MSPRYAVAALTLIATPLGAQQFDREPDTAPVLLGLFGFGARVGIDLEDGHGVLGYTLDIGHLYTDRLRLRPSAEIGIKEGVNDFVGSAELTYRFTPDSAAAVPYVGTGIALAAVTGCASNPECPSLWLQVVLGFEVRTPGSFNWLLEYHWEDALRRHRLFVGLTTRRGW